MVSLLRRPAGESRRVSEPCQWWNCKGAHGSRSKRFRWTLIVIRSSLVSPKVVLRSTRVGYAKVLGLTNQRTLLRGFHRNGRQIPPQKLRSENSLERRRERTYRHSLGV